jgi:hypothetical protein
VAQSFDILIKIPTNTAFAVLKMSVDREKTGGGLTIQSKGLGHLQHLYHLDPFPGFFPRVLGVSERLGLKSGGPEKQASDQGSKKKFTTHFP